MKKLTGQEIRETWIRFFESKGHRFMPGVNLIPQDDKSLLWVNAGVTGLKKYFDGSELPPCRRIVNIQKSIRTNDIENVGHTARHHTFFEMLGNFSIGDYFRKEVIAWAYEILTSDVGFGMDKEKIYVTYNPNDEETYKRWREVGVEADHLIPLEGNYWQIGEGPCGPNTEVFFDRGEKWDPHNLGVKLLKDDVENDRYIEIWGIVFSQYNAVNGVARENYKELPSKNIDTGAGLERIACILQETPTNFETDLFMPIIKKTEELSGRKYTDGDPMPFRVIADHARCLTFALGDGAFFSNEGRGYVLRRIIRRAMRYGQKIGLNQPFMYRLVETVASKYREFYPELSRKQEEISKMIKAEEEKFLKTLTSGEALLKEMLVGQKTLSGEMIFKLADTHGFPAELTKEIAEENGVSCDMAGYTRLMEEQRERARKARGEIESFHKQSQDLMEFKSLSFFDYDQDRLTAKAIGLFIDGKRVKSLEEKGDVIFDKTPFYAEMGGQASDRGFIENKEMEGIVEEVGKAPNGQHLHHVVMKYGTLREGDYLVLSIDSANRRLTERNHSATHLLHAALSKVLGHHAKQMGSFVNGEYLRFDYETDRRPSREELSAIEQEVNDKIFAGIIRETLILPLEEAKKTGAEMEFSEKYGDEVRVVSFGDYSKEFCGGTHVKNTQDIGLFVIKSDEAVSSGVRRIEALTSSKAYDFLAKKMRILSDSANLLGVSEADLTKRLAMMSGNATALEKENEALKEKMASLEAKTLGEEIEVREGIALSGIVKEGADRDSIIKLGDSLKSHYKDYALVILGGSEGNRPAVVFIGGKALLKLKAGEVMKRLAKELGGSGGGRPEMASGQLKSKDGFEKAVDSIFKDLK